MHRCAVVCAPKALSAPAVTQALQSLPGWKLSGNSQNVMECNYVFEDFMEAIRYMNAIVPFCEQMQHHPSWSNVYNRLRVELTTHDAGNRLTQKDVDLAKVMCEVYDAMRKR
ncbi:hypothetical protein JKF63_06975 [Porcisia hertigi]|uniref:4a-hydroxytetrahydrobiopterin dehydratase n=1 Tax=Porcisia hertigi TaxID=2761500 RepID=A0A836LGJ6_9TRYP|nr:hypothetical protein JKF63_06975 [Porcisia hertigi]